MQDNSLPKSIGNYEVERELGLGKDRGGMGRVYRAHLPGQRSVVLKVGRERRNAALLNEADILSQLKHPNIVRILPVRHQDKTTFVQKEHVEGEPCFVMALELVEGRSAGNGRFAPGQVARIVQEVASGLDYAHQRGIAHLDVKPANILVSPDLRRVVLIDWGTAEVIEKPRETQGRFYTPEYVSPERVEGGPADIRNDVYSLGVTAYELLVGAVPYKKTTARETARAHISDPLPVEPLKKLPPAVQAVLRKALAKKPADRYASAGALAADLGRVLPKVGPRRLVGVAAAALVALGFIMAVAYGAYAFMGGDKPVPRQVLPTAVSLTTEPRTTAAPSAVEPNGTPTPVPQSTIAPTFTPTPMPDTPTVVWSPTQVSPAPALVATEAATIAPAPSTPTRPADTPTRTPSPRPSPTPVPPTPAPQQQGPPAPPQPPPPPCGGRYQPPC